MNILIYGSCVTRDAFSFVPNKHKITAFIARNSIATTFRGRAFPVTMNQLGGDDITSSWPRKMLQMNLEASVPSYIKEKARSSDLMIVDLIDERLPLIDMKGVSATYSSEFAELREMNPSEKIPHGSDKRKRMTEMGIRTLVMFAQELGLPLLLNKAKWSSDPKGGREHAYADIRNEELEGMFAIFDKMGVPSISYEAHTFQPDPKHKWGPAPYHYTKSTYEKLIEGVDAFSQKISKKRANVFEP